MAVSTVNGESRLGGDVKVGGNVWIGNPTVGKSFVHSMETYGNIAGAMFCTPGSDKPAECISAKRVLERLNALDHLTS